MIGKTISRYRIVEKLGEGGMGVVYKAEDTKLHRTVALKFLTAEATGSREHQARFLKEAEAAAALEHPNITTIFDIGEEDGQTFIAMSLVEGKTLAEKISERPLPLEEALHIAGQVGEALQVAHERGIVHRDIKPANIMITPDGRVKVMDFGLAHLAGQTRITKTGTIMGTPAYMSPEQAEGQELDRRSDIWSLGIVLYEMVTGQLPFRGNTDPAVLRAILDDQPEPMTAIRVGTPPELDRIVAKALEKEPGQRYQGMADLLVDLRSIVTSDGSAGVATARSGGTPPEAGRGRRVVLLAVLCAVLLAGLVGTWALGWSAGSTGGLARETRSLRRFTLQPDAEVSSWLEISPNGRYVGYRTATESWTVGTLWLHDLQQNTVRQIPVSTGGADRFWSSDSLFVGLGSGMKRQITRISVADEIETSILNWPEDPGMLRGISLSPDLETLVYSAGPAYNKLRLFRTSLEGEEPELVFEPDETEAIHGFMDPHYLPAGGLLYSIGVPLSADIGVLDFKTGKRKILASSDRSLRMPVYSPTGHIVYWEQPGRLWALPFSQKTLSATGPPFVIAERARYPSIANDSTLVYVSLNEMVEKRLRWRDRRGELLGEIGQPQDNIFAPVLSPDGTEVVVIGIEEGTQDIWVHEVARELKRRLTFDEVRDERPLWNMEGDRVVFSRNPGGPFDVYVKSADGSGEEQLLVASPDSDMAYGWTPDGRYILGSGSGRLWYARKDDGGSWEKVMLDDGRFDIVGPVLSPDGTYVAYASNETGQHEIYVRTFPEFANKVQVSAGGGVQARWRGDGKELFYVQDDSLMAVSVGGSGRFSVDRPERLFDGNGAFGGRGQRYDVTPDGKRFVLVEEIGSGPPPTIQVVLNWYEEFRDREH
jgi:eukaryotic-like serine/threonine-protein kinase